jgi:hypothetical protein
MKKGQYRLTRAPLPHRLSRLIFVSADDRLLNVTTAEGLATNNPHLHP